MIVQSKIAIIKVKVFSMIIIHLQNKNNETFSRFKVWMHLKIYCKDIIEMLLPLDNA